MKNTNQYITFLSLVLVFLVSCQTKNTKQEQAISSTSNEPKTKVYKQLLSNIANAYKPLTDLPSDSTAIPRSLESNGELRGVPSKDWCSGFYPGIWWMLYAHTGDSLFAKEAEEWTNFIKKEKNNIYTHDLGFMIYCSVGWGYQLTERKDYRAVIVQSAKSLKKRFNKKIGLIQSWDTPAGHKWTFPVIIDNMMNLELLFAATDITGDSSFFNIAVSHADVTLKNHFRSDNSSFHVVDYDTLSGNPRKYETHQGIAHESAWSRGQGWGLYGYTLMYRATKKEQYLEQANKIADYIIGKLPNDYVPYWDFDDPEIPDAPRDASAAALYASAFLELQKYVTAERKETYLQTAHNLLSQLNSEAYIRTPTVEAPFLLNHATGNYPADDEIDVPIIYADYYYIEALLRGSQLVNSF